jgi:hypothetical protein
MRDADENSDAKIKVFHFISESFLGILNVLYGKLGVMVLASPGSLVLRFTASSTKLIVGSPLSVL